ncbi:MAG TPA: DUF1553 domain-containing protein, partial [Pirellulales bacterium]
FPSGSQAVQLPNSPRNLGIRRPTPVHTPAVTTPLHLNLDFCNASAEAGGSGYYRVALDHPENGYSPAVELFINAEQAAIREGDGFKSIAPLALGVWYNLQVQVDWPAKTFSGVISNGREQWTFENAPFNPTWDGMVNSWVVDAHVPGNEGPRPLRQLDNFAIQTVPFAPATATTTQTAAETEARLAQLRESVGVLRKERDEFARRAPFPTVYGVVEGKPANARLQFRGEPERLGEEVPRRFLEILGGERLPENSQESGRRQLAEWLTSPQNPLTARVMVNRIWLHHFGRGIVATPNDFGVRGAPPSHPELLDYLASRFQQEGYSVKAMHRLMLTSQAYRLSSQRDPRAMQVDPDNASFCRRERKRLDAESLRDAWLLLSGELDLTVGEGHPFPDVSTWRFSQHNPFDAVYASNRRTVYLMTQRIKRHPFLALFDGPDPNSTTGKRESTTTPSQALFMMNDEFVQQRPLAYAKRLLSTVPDEREQIVRVYEEAYSRRPAPEEIDAALAFRRRYEERTADDPNRVEAALAAYLRVIFSSNEFLYLN